MISIDTETTGVDLRHGAKPFFVSTAQEDGIQTYWEWRVDPLTRQPIVPVGDLREIDEYISYFHNPAADELILQNAKFDVSALITLSPEFAKWDWARTHDTLDGAHLLASNLPKDLTALANRYLGKNIKPLEDAVEACVVDARKVVKKLLPNWAVAKKGRPDMPSAGEETWKYDMWLPRAVLHELGMDRVQEFLEKKVHTWETVTAEYANGDTAVTLLIWKVMRDKITERNLWKIYGFARHRARLAHGLESYGVTISENRTRELQQEFGHETTSRGAVCIEIAKRYTATCDHKWHQLEKPTRPRPVCPRCQSPRPQDPYVLQYDLELPKGAAPNNNLRRLLLEVMGLPPQYSDKSKTGAPTLDKDALAAYADIIEQGTQEHDFVVNLLGKRAYDTALSYMASYERYWRPWVDVGGKRWPGVCRLHPSLNATGTKTLRWSCSNPNEQNIGKKPEANIRKCFGPAPGREWWALDGKNLELRLPAYESNEDELIELFERPNDPPFYGSNHLLIFSILWPKLWQEAIDAVGLENAGPYCKKKYAATQYQWTKNGNFAVQYGAIDREDGQGTADRTYKIKGAQSRIKARFLKQEALNQRCIQFATVNGYVETIPDKTVDPRRGYPLLCTRTEYGRILETVPLNYHVQGSAMWWTVKGMIRVDEFFSELNRGAKYLGRQWPGGYYMTMQVHDELDIDTPSGRGKGANPWDYNLPIATEVKRLMELGGDDFNIPTPVGLEYHPVHWADGKTIA